jgi:hypothetical protein
LLIEMTNVYPAAARVVSRSVVGRAGNIPIIATDPGGDRLE